LRRLKVLTANENRAAIGFLDDTLPGRRPKPCNPIPCGRACRRSCWPVRRC
jgi:hypothetical protein